MNNINRRREIISIQGGQGGVQLGHAMWELLTIEHDISSGGNINSPPDDDAFTTFFSQSSNDQYFPRTLIFDTEPTVIDEIRCGYYRKLFHPEMLINGYQDASNNFARGYLGEAKHMIFTLVEKTRHMIENCDNFSGFLVQSGTAGGTGSGLLSALMEHLLTEFAGRTNVQLSIFPGQKLSNCIVQPYNCILSAEKLIYYSDLNIIVDNEMLYSIGYNQFDIERPSFSNINRIISPILSGLTAPIRFQGMINSDLKEISTNLVPYPSLHFPLVSYAPLISTEKMDHEFLNNESLTRSLFEHYNQFVDLDLKNGVFLSSALLYRGNCDLSCIHKTVQAIKREKDFHWVDWCPTGFKISHTIQNPISIPMHSPLNYDKAAMMISNHSGIASTLVCMENKFNILFKKKAYLHWYAGEGMEENEFLNALYEVNIISEDYSNIVDRIFNNLTYKASSVKLSTSGSKDIVNETDTNELKHDPILRKKVLNISEEINEVSKETTESKTNSDDSASSNPKSIYAERGYEINLYMPPKQTQVPNFSNLLRDKLSRQKSSEETHVDSLNVSNMIYEICERNYLAQDFNTFPNQKRILRQISSLKNNSNENIIKKICRKNKKLFNKFTHCQKYDVTTLQIN